LVFSGVIEWQEDGASGESSFDGVQTDLGLGFRALRAGTVLGIRSVGSEAGFGDWLLRLWLGGFGVGRFGHLLGLLCEMKKPAPSLNKPGASSIGM
jgi:hypothetical protein